MPSFDIERVGDLEEDLVNTYDIAMADDETLAAAVLTSASYLKVAQYRLSPNGGMANFGITQVPGQCTDVSLALPTATQWLTSVKRIAGGSPLWLQQWNRSNPTRDTQGALCSVVKIAAFRTSFTLVPTRPPQSPGGLSAGPTGYLVATAHTVPGTQQLRVTSWISGGSNLEELASAVAPGRVTQTAIVAHQIQPGHGVLHTATVITASLSAQKLRLATWRLHVEPGASPSVEFVSEVVTEDEITEVAATTFSRLIEECLATAVITKEGQLKVITWRIRSDGTLTRWLEASAGEASSLDLVRLRQSDLAVGCRDSENKVRIIYWRFPFAPTDGTAVLRLGTATAGESTGAIRLAHTSSTATQPGDTVVACRTSAGKFKLIRFRVTNGAG